MRKLLLLIAAIGLSGAMFDAPAQDRTYSIMFYNVENLFDTINSPDVLDEEFTPDGPKQWNTYKYRKKLDNLEKVFYDMAATNRAFPTIIGVSEIENRNVLEDLVAMPKLAKANYQIAHYDSPDARGVDVALLYRPDQFKYEGSYPIPTVVPGLPDFKTRDILSVWGTIEGERFCFFVCHWPSRLGSDSESKRIAAAEVIKHAADSIMLDRPDTKIVIMGDMNDNPTDKSMAQVLNAKAKAKDVEKGGFFNPYYQMLQDGLGTLAYQDAWNIYDNMIVNENLLNATTGKLKLQKNDKYYGNIFRRSYMLQTGGRYKGYPLRTFVGNNFQGGYSDHFPVFLLISK